MTKVLIDGIIYQSQKRGGISRYFNQLLSHLEPYADELNMYLHLPAGCEGPSLNPPYVKRFQEWNLRPRSVWSFLTRSIALTGVRVYTPDIFHSTYYTPPPWPGLRQILTVHDMTHETYPALFDNRWIADVKRRLIESADAIIAVSNATRDDILKFVPVPPEKITVIHHGASQISNGNLPQIELPDNAGSIGTDSPFFLYVGPRGTYKNFRTLLRAFCRLAAEWDGNLVAVGGAPSLDSWESDFLIQHRMHLRVPVLSDVGDDLLGAMYARAAALVIPSLAEGFGLPILEAMVAGTPVICSDIPVFREVAGDAALFFDPYDHEQLGQRMIETLDPLVRNKLVERGRQRAAKFSWEETAAQTLNLYRRLCA